MKQSKTTVKVNQTLACNLFLLKTSFSTNNSLTFH